MISKKNRIIRASLFLFLASWYNKILAIITMVILARNLEQYDFGIIAACFVIQGMFNSISNLGGNQYLIRKKHISEEDINVAWTINIILKFSVAFILFSSSSYIALYMKIPELSNVLKIMALSPLFIGLKNPGLSVSIKALDYSKISILEICSKSVSSSVSIFIVLLYQSYWAIVIADVVYYFVNTIGSYYIVSNKLKIRFKNISSQWDFSKWILLKGIIAYVKYNVDKILLSRAFSVETLGLYSFSQDTASMAKNILINPLRGVIYPSLSEYLDDYKVLADKIHKSVLFLCCIYIPVVFGGVYLSGEIVPVIFGEKWIEAVPLFDMFICMTFAGLFIDVFSTIFTLTGKVKEQFYYELITSIIVVIIIWYVSSFSLTIFTVSRMVVSYMLLYILLCILKKQVGISIFRMVILVSPIILSSVSMIYIMEVCLSNFYFLGEVGHLIFSIIFGAIFYFLFLVFTIILAKGFIAEYEFMYQIFKFDVLKYKFKKLYGNRK